MAKLALILGGARSGKSRFAQQLATTLGGDRVLFVATAKASDLEMARRIQIHQDSRPAAWDLLEIQLGVGEALAAAPDDHPVVLIDCLTLLVSNVLFNLGNDPAPETAEKRVRAETASLLDASQRRQGTVIIVSGEVGLGLVPTNSLGRMFRDLLGWANQTIAAQCDAAYLLVAGLPIELKSLTSTLDQAAAVCSAFDSRRS